MCIINNFFKQTIYTVNYFVPKDRANLARQLGQTRAEILCMKNIIVSTFLCSVCFTGGWP